MDTKLKNSKYHPLIKLVAVLLTITFAFFTGVNALNFIRKGVFYASEDGKLKNTPAFSSEIISTIWRIHSLSDSIGFYDKNLTYKEYLKTDKAKDIIKDYNQKEDRAIKLFNTIQELKKLRPSVIKTEQGSYEIKENGYVYFPERDEYVKVEEFYDTYNDYYYDGEYSEQVTSVVVHNYDGEEITYPADDKELFSIKEEYKSYSEWNYKYQQLRNAIFDIVDTAVSIEQIKEELHHTKTRVLEGNYYTDITQITEKLNSFVNVKFVLTNNKTGKLISNVEEASRESFLDDLYGNSIYTIDFDGHKLHSEPNSLNYSTNLLKFLRDTYIIEGVVIDEAYLSERFEGYTLQLKIDDISIRNSTGDAYHNMYSVWKSLPKSEADTLLFFTLISAFLSIACFAGCCIMSGKQKDGSIKTAHTDKILFIIYLAFTIAFIGAIGLGVVTLAFIDYYPEEISQQYPGFEWLLTPDFTRNTIGLGFALISLFLLSFVLYIVRNVRAGTFGNTFIVIYFKRKIKNSIQKTKAKLSEKEINPEQIKRRIKTQTILFFVGYVVINIIFYIFAMAEWYPVSIIGLIIFNGLALVYAMLYISDVVRLAKIAEEIRKGNYKTTINIKNYVKPLRLFASDLSACRDGIENAINEAIKGEHLKTELITNVSHDLKTPLTSIINYVSLLKMGNIEGEEERKYIEILDEKSKKLKRLIEDLTEASKANSGNIKMNVAQVNLNEMALQAVGENSDVLENAGLDVVLTEKDSEIIVNADSQHTFRIIDNLFSNARKYSLTGTRVYVDVYKENGYGVFEIKNISREKLNIDPQELTERFVRGDNSRTTDGSGLGLSIAQSFAELQNGIFNIEIDGDMFKAVVKLPLI